MVLFKGVRQSLAQQRKCVMESNSTLHISNKRLLIPYSYFFPFLHVFFFVRPSFQTPCRPTQVILHGSKSKDYQENNTDTSFPWSKVYANVYFLQRQEGPLHSSISEFLVKRKFGESRKSTFSYYMAFASTRTALKLNAEPKLRKSLEVILYVPSFVNNMTI